MEEPFGEGLSGLYILTAIGGIAFLVAGRARSVIARLLSLGFIAVGLALAWWLVRWFGGDGCTDTPDACEGLESAMVVIFTVWVSLAVCAAALAIARAIGDRDAA